MCDTSFSSCFVVMFVAVLVVKYTSVVQLYFSFLSWPPRGQGCQPCLVPCGGSDSLHARRTRAPLAPALCRRDDPPSAWASLSLHRSRGFCLPRRGLFPRPPRLPWGSWDFALPISCCLLFYFFALLFSLLFFSAPLSGYNWPAP